MGIGEIGNVKLLGEQLSLAPGTRRKMLFLNDCDSACVKLLTRGLDDGEYVYVDVSSDKSNTRFDVEDYVTQNIMPHLHEFIPEVTGLRESGR